MRIGTYAIIIALFLSACTMTAQNTASEQISLKLIAEGFVSPVDIRMPNDGGSNRLFVVDRPGVIKIIENGKLLDKPFLDIQNKVIKLVPAYDERGLLSIAFHPDFIDNGKFYVIYSAPLRSTAPKDYSSTLTLSEFTVSNDINVANASSERILLQVDNPYLNHNGGQLEFGPDGYLYYSKGDGGNANDVGLGHNPTIGNGQDLTTLLGKVWRIDVDSKSNGKEYGIPKDNPFADGKEGLPEIYAYGFRNPWRSMFNDGKYYVGDVGQNLWEEIDIVEKGGNYGWNIKEGTHCFDPKSPNKSPLNCSNVGYHGEPLIDPVIEYANLAQQKNGVGHANLGGYIYEGNAIPSLKGKFVFGDWSTSFVLADGTLFVAVPQQKGLWPFSELKVSGKANGKIGEYILSLGRDNDNELYVLTTSSTGPAGNTGKVYKIIPA